MSPQNLSITPAPSNVELQPFPHQVAGQSLILRYDVTTICKSVIPRERQFYMTHDKSLRPFVPQYKGVFHLHLPSDPTRATADSSGGIEADSVYDAETSTSDWLTPETDPASSLTVPVLVGGSSLVKPEYIRGLRKSCNTEGTNGLALYELLLLEDVVSKFENPCVLDLKMGTRQHGDDAPADKIAYQVKKCKSTTSGSLGIRLCGMKKFHEPSGQYETKNKTHGRHMTDNDIKTEITNFLSSQGTVRHDIVSAILERLRNLRTVVQELDGYRFYSCSLLIVYEGASQRVQVDKHPENVRNSARHFEENSLGYSGDGDSTGCDHTSSANPRISDLNCGAMSKHVSEAIDKRIEHRGQISDNSSSKCSVVPAKKASESNFGCESKSTNCSLNTATSDFSSTNGNARSVEDSVEVRVVDFAHATFPGFHLNSGKQHSGPDRGFLIGLTSLIDILSQLKANSS